MEVCRNERYDHLVYVKKLQNTWNNTNYFVYLQHY